jgi:hypothetical protein
MSEDENDLLDSSEHRDEKVTAFVPDSVIMLSMPDPRTGADKTD